MAEESLEARAQEARALVARASAVVREAQAAVDAVAVDMLSAGWSFARIGAAFGFSRSRAQQVAARCLKRP